MLLQISLTHSVQKQLGFGGEVVIDDVVQHGDVNTTSGNVCNKQHHGFSMNKAADVDLPGRLIQSTVDIGTLNAL